MFCLSYLFGFMIRMTANEKNDRIWLNPSTVRKVSRVCLSDLIKTSSRYMTDQVYANKHN